MRLRRVAILALLPLLGLVPGAAALPATNSLPVDPDNLGWLPPAGHLPVSDLVRLDWTHGQIRPQQGGPGDPPGREGSLEQVGVHCGSEPKKYERQLNVRACWYLYRLVGEGDGAFDYFWEEFLIGATGKGATNISRVKGRNASTNSENIRWRPEGDRDYGSPTTETYTLGMTLPAAGGGSVTGSLSRATNIFPGRIHPYPDDRLYHSSWITNEDDGAPPDRTIDSAGMNVWQVPESADGISTEIRWDVWCGCY